jgi:tetratricopeptide (TPR) repeat protein
MEAGGAEIIQGRSLCLAPEDFLVIPQESTNTFPLRPDIVVRQVETLEANPSRWLTTMNFYMRANFFVSDFISLPFAIGHAPPEKYDILATADIDGGEGECDDVVAGYTRKLFDEYERHDFVARYPYYVNLLNDRANAYCAKGEYERAISDYTNALIAWPYEAGIYYNRAKAYLLKGDRGRASRDFKTARSLGFKKIGTATI